MITPSLFTPSEKGGFARSAGASAFPGRWKGVIGSWEPSLGPTGETLFDQSGRSKDGVLTNMSLAADWVIGGNERAPGYVLDYDAGNKHVNIDAINDLIDVTRGSVILWTSLRTSASGGNFLDIRVTGNSHQISIEWIVGDGEVRLLYFEGSVTEIRTTQIQENSGWHQLVITWDTVVSSLMIAYVDGLQEGTPQTIPTVISGTINQSRIGGPASVTMDGQIGGVTLYDRVLSAAEIQQDYDDPLARFRLGSRRIPVGAVGNPWYYYANQAAVVG